jgi:hypothetical protein
MSNMVFVDPSVESTWTDLRRKAERLIAGIENLSDDQRALTPPKGFNSVETLIHLGLTDKFELGLIKKTSGPLDKAPKVNFIGKAAMNGMRRPRPMPTMSEMTPPAGQKPSQEAAVKAGQDWMNVLDQITPFVAQSKSGQTMLKHPLFGRFGPLELAALMTVHLEYHVMRIQEVIPEFRP